MIKIYDLSLFIFDFYLKLGKLSSQLFEFFLQIYHSVSFLAQLFLQDLFLKLHLFEFLGLITSLLFGSLLFPSIAP